MHICPPLTDTAKDYDVMTVEVLSSSRLEELRRETLADTICQYLTEVITAGWPDSSKKLPHSLRQFYSMRDELTTDNGLVLRGLRFISPHSLHHYYVK